jgi:hypothetical protein
LRQERHPPGRKRFNVIVRWWKNRTLSQQWVMVLLAFALVPLGVVLALHLGSKRLLNFSESRVNVDCKSWQFDAGAWVDPASQQGGGMTVRQRLAEGLAQCGHLKGRQRSEVLELLGRPDFREGRREWVYVIGTDFTGDNKVFVVPFERIGQAQQPVLSL